MAPPLAQYYRELPSHRQSGTPVILPCLSDKISVCCEKVDQAGRVRARKKREGPPFPLETPKYGLFLFPEVALEQTCEGLAVTGFVAGHFVDGASLRSAEEIVLFWLLQSK